MLIKLLLAYVRAITIERDRREITVSFVLYVRRQEAAEYVDEKLRSELAAALKINGKSMNILREGKQHGS